MCCAGAPEQRAECEGRLHPPSYSKIRPDRHDDERHCKSMKWIKAWALIHNTRWIKAPITPCRQSLYLGNQSFSCVVSKSQPVPFCRNTNLTEPPIEQRRRTLVRSVARNRRVNALAWKLVQCCSLFCWWLISAVQMYVSHQQDSYSFEYTSNRPDQFVEILILSLGELAVLYLILRPWSYRNSMMRSSVALFLLTPWLIGWTALSQQGNPVLLTHWLWLAMVELGIIVSLVVSLSGTLNKGKKS